MKWLWKKKPEPRWIEDGFGNYWELCDREDCGLQIVRPGKVQCECDYQ